MNQLITTDPTIQLMQAAQTQAKHRAEMLEKSKDIANYEKIDEAAKEFEAVFLSEMLKPMFAEVNQPDPLFGGGQGEAVFKGFMVQEYGKLMAERGGIGIAEHVKSALIHIQEEMSNGDR
ncbi:MAG: rod-binding protein [Rhodospirillales bacterium]|nr:rod-binding protein [Rhodospirillales bacterium]